MISMDNEKDEQNKNGDQLQSSVEHHIISKEKKKGKREYEMTTKNGKKEEDIFSHEYFYKALEDFSMLPSPEYAFCTPKGKQKNIENWVTKTTYFYAN